MSAASRHGRVRDRRGRTARGARATLAAGALALAALGGCATSEIVDDPLVARVYEAIGTGDVTVRNDGGTITLGGFVEGVGTEQAYVEAASRVPGVERVESDIIVRGGEDG